MTHDQAINAIFKHRAMSAGYISVVNGIMVPEIANTVAYRYH